MTSIINSKQSTQLDIAQDNKKQTAVYELTILKSSAMMGVKTPPDVQMLGMISEFVFKYYKNFTTEDVEEAFRYAAFNGVEHYGSMDIQYVARVMNSYKHIVDTRFKRKQEQQTNLLIENVPEMSDKDAYDTLLGMYKKNNEFPMIFCWAKAFNGLINALPKDMAQMYLDEVRETTEHCTLVLKAEAHSENRGKETFIIRQHVESISSVDGERLAKKKVLIKHIDQHESKA